jgi:hypothetical protein
MFDVMFTGRQLVFDSPLTLAEATSRLQQEVTAPAWPLWRDRRTQSFEGTFADGQFQMSRLDRRKKTLGPVIKGRISQGTFGARIDASIQVHPLALGFYAIFTLFFSTIAGFILGLAPIPGNSPLAAQFVVLALLILILGAVQSSEIRKSLKLLSRVFAVEPRHAGAPPPRNPD